MQSLAVAERVVRQLIHDRRFLGLSLFVPVAIIYMLWVFFDAVEHPYFDVNTFVVPVGAFLVHFITYVLCMIVLVRERTLQTLERMFVNGYTRSSVISGYLIAYSVIATVQSLIVIVLLMTLFDLGYSLQTMLEIYAVIWLLAVISISLGICVSNFAHNEGQVIPFIPLIITPSAFFSGMLVDMTLMPDWAQVFSYTTPMYYANETIQSIISGGSINSIVALIVYGGAVMLLATLTLRDQES